MKEEEGKESQTKETVALGSRNGENVRQTVRKESREKFLKQCKEEESTKKCVKEGKSRYDISHW